MEPNSRYANLDFARDTIWGKFLGLYVDVTRRELRPGAGAVLHIEFPENAFILVRKNFPISRGGDLELNPIKNPPDGFHRCKCEI